jgi:hypothetical protein
VVIRNGHAAVSLVALTAFIVTELGERLKKHAMCSVRLFALINLVLSGIADVTPFACSASRLELFGALWFYNEGYVTP